MRSPHALVMMIRLLLCICLSEGAAADGQLVFASIIRVPGTTTPVDPRLLNITWLWDNPVNQLSIDGIIQDFGAGKKLKWLLTSNGGVMNPGGLLNPQSLDVGNSLRVFSSDDDVHVQSAQALLRGLFGQRDRIQMVPIHPTNDLAAYLDCPTVDRIRFNAAHDPRWVQRTAERDTSALIKSLHREFPASQRFSTPELMLKGLPEFTDGFSSVASSRFNVSSAFSGWPSALARESEHLMWDSIKLSNWAQTRPYIWKEYNQIGGLTGGLLMRTLLEQMASAGAEGSPRVTIYSARKDNMMGILSLLKATALLDAKPPGFGSELIFKGFKSAAAAGDLQVTLEYNGDNVEIPICKSPCSHSRLRQMLQTELHHTLPGEWDVYCESQLPYCEGVELQSEQLPLLSLLPMWAVAGVLLGLLLLGILVLIVSRWQRGRNKQSRRDAMITVEI